MKPTTYKFRANDGEPDRYQDRLSVRGWDLTAFNANPIILFNHNDQALPIGKGRAFIEGDALMVDIEFDQDDEFAKKVESKVAKGILSAVSVRYLMKNFKANSLGGFDSAEQELLEISVVTIPGNQRAVRVKSLGAHERILNAGLVSPQLGAAPEGTKQMDREELKSMFAEQRESLKDEIASAVTSRLSAGARGVPAIASPSTPRVKGAGLSAFVLAWAAAGGARGTPDRAVLAERLRSFGFEGSKALQESVFTAGGSHVPVEFSSEFIELLVPRLVLAELGAEQLNFKSELHIGKTDSGPTAEWIGEGAAPTKSTPVTSKLVVRPHKLAIRTDLSNDLLRNPAAGYSDAMLARDLVRAAAKEVENQGINGVGSSGAPKGILNLMDSSQSFSKAGTSAANYIADVDKLVRVVDQTDRARERRGFLLSPVVEGALLGLRDSAGWVFREEMLQGRLRGFPCRVSTLVPDTHLVFGEFSDLIWAVDTGMELASSESDRFDFDETALRLITRVDFALKHKKSFACINNY